MSPIALGRCARDAPLLGRKHGRETPRGAQLGREQVEHRQLRGEGLGRGHADLGPRVCGIDGVGHSRDLASGHVHDRADRRARAPGFGQGRDGVRRLAGLRDADRQRLSVHDRPPVAELAAVIDLDGNPGHALDEELPDEARVPGRPAGQQQDTVVALDLLRGQERRIDVQLPRLEGDLPAQRLRDRRRLLVDLLRHEVAVAALLRGHGVPHDAVDRPLETGALRVVDRHALRVDARHVPVLEENDVARPRNERHGVRSHVVFAIAETQGDRRARAGGHEHAGLAARGHEHGVSAGELLHRRAHRRVEVALEGRLDFVREDLGVGLAVETMAGLRERGLALGEVLEDAVVGHDDLAGAVSLGMGVELRRPAVRRPARVSDPGRPDGGREAELLDEVAELARGPVDREAPVRKRGDPGRVVASVFEPFQTLDQERPDLAGTGDSDDSAHGLPRGEMPQPLGPRPARCHGRPYCSSRTGESQGAGEILENATS